MGMVVPLGDGSVEDFCLLDLGALGAGSLGLLGSLWGCTSMMVPLGDAMVEGFFCLLDLEALGADPPGLLGSLGSCMVMVTPLGDGTVVGAWLEEGLG